MTRFVSRLPKLTSKFSTIKSSIKISNAAYANKAPFVNNSIVSKQFLANRNIVNPAIATFFLSGGLAFYYLNNGNPQVQVFHLSFLKMLMDNDTQFISIFQVYWSSRMCSFGK